MHLVEMPEGVRQLGQHDGAVAAVHAADVIAFKCVHEALGHAIRLRAVDRRVHRFDPQFMRQGVRLDCPESAAIIAQEFKRNRPLVRAAKACLYRLDHHVAYRFARQATADPGTPGDDLAVTAVLHEYARYDVAVVTGDLKAVRAPTLVRFLDGYLAIMSAAAVPPLGDFGSSKPSAFITRYMRL
jgi:hypothetical protein